MRRVSRVSVAAHGAAVWGESSHSIPPTLCSHGTAKPAEEQFAIILVVSKFKDGAPKAIKWIRSNLKKN